MITLYIGKSGAGKDTFLNKMVKCGIKPIISYTTRPMRTGEVDGKDYNFVSNEEFDKIYQEGGMFETRAYKTLFNGVKDVWNYGSPKVDPKDDYVAVVDINGAKSYIKTYGPDNINIIYVYVNDEERKRRAIMRGTFSEEEWNRRLEDDKQKFSVSEMKSLIRLLGKQIVAINNNGVSPTMRKLGWFKEA